MKAGPQAWARTWRGRQKGGDHQKKYVDFSHTMGRIETK